MPQQPGNPATEVKRLERCMNDLVSVLALPAVWSSSESNRILDTFLDALLVMLDLDFLYARVRLNLLDALINMLRTGQFYGTDDNREGIRQALNQWSGEVPEQLPEQASIQLGKRQVSIFFIKMGIEGELGFIVAGSQRPDFPVQTERLLLSVAANQAAIGLQQAQRLNEQKQIASELDRRVAERTREFAKANEELRMEIASRTRAERDLRSSEEKHRVVVEAASDAIVSMDESGTIVFANPATERIFGYDPTELVGKPLTVLMPRSMRELHENGFKRYLATRHRHINWQGTELTALRRNGQEFQVEVSFGELTTEEHGLFTGFIRDISQRKQAEEMRATQTRLVLVRADVRLAFRKEESLDTTLHECAESIVRHLDAAFARIWILDREENILELRASAGLYTHLDGAHAHIPIGKLKIGMIAQDQKPLLTNDLIHDPLISDQAWVAREGMAGFAGYPLVAGARTLGVMAVFSRKALTTGTIEVLASAADLIALGVERKHAEDELRTSELRLKETESELARVARLTAMGELAASIAHEVNQPLTAVISNSSACLRLLANRNLEPDVLRRALEEIVADGTRASSVLARIRAFIRKEPAEKSELDINEVIQEVLLLSGRELNDNRVSLDRELRTDLPPVLADRVQMQQVLLNLIMNGIEAMAEVTDRPRLLEVHSRMNESGNVLVTISDSGTGFGVEADRVFTPFYSTKANGMGMGLSISRSLVESHGGRLWATPKSPHGARMSFTLPATGGSLT